MPTTPKAHLEHTSPYSRPTDAQQASEPSEHSEQARVDYEAELSASLSSIQPQGASQPQEPTDEQLQAALQLHAAPEKTATKRSIDWRQLTYEVLRETLTLQEPKTMDAGVIIAFARFNLAKFCELTNTPPNSISLKSFRGNLTVKMPFARMPFGINNKFTDEKTGRPKYTLSMGLYNPDCQQELDDFADWLENTYKRVLVDLVVETLPKWGVSAQTAKADVASQRMIIESTMTSPIQESKKEGFKPNLNLKLKNRDDVDEPLLQAWNQKTQGKVAWNLIQHGDLGSPFICFEGLTKVNTTFYPRIHTQELVFCDAVTRAEANNMEETFPID